MAWEWRGGDVGLMQERCWIKARQGAPADYHTAFRSYRREPWMRSDHMD
jgi:hypothetical protein